MMNSEICADFDFEAFCVAAKEDQAAFESMRQQLIDELITSAPVRSQERLRCLQWRIDQERRLSRTPMAACIRISKMMWRNVLGEGGLRDRFHELGEMLQGEIAKYEPEQSTQQSAKIYAFEAPQNRS